MTTRNRMTLGDAVRQAVRDFKGTQRGLCRLAGISESALSHFVAGRKELSVIRLDRLADALGLELRRRPRGAAKASAADGRKLSRKSRRKRGRKGMAR